MVARRIRIGSAASYTGPGDIVSGWKAWYGLRAFNAAYATGSNPAVDLHNDSTGVFTATINILSTGNLDVATAATVIAGGSSKIGKFYDQSGNGFHMTQSTLTLMPVLTLSVFGSRPATTWDVLGVDTKMTSSSLTQAQPMSFSGVINPGASAVNAAILRNVADTVKFSTRTNIPNIYVVAGGSEISQASTNNATNRAQGVLDGASSLTSVNGSTSGAGNAGSTGISAEGLFINFQGHIGEVALRTGAFSGGDITALESNQSAYWV